MNERKLVPDEVIFILEGIPRARTQAEIVDQIADMDLVVNLECTNRRKSSKMGSNRFFLSQTKPLEDYYRKQHILIDFQVKAAPGETWHGLLAALHLQHINAVNSSQKLTA